MTNIPRMALDFYKYVRAYMALHELSMTGDWDKFKNRAKGMTQ